MIPLTARVYLEERKAITGTRPWLGDKTLSKFSKLEDRLDRYAIDYANYVRISTKLWQSWAEERGMNFPPVSVICGWKAIQRYAELDPITSTEEQHGIIAYFVDSATQATVRLLVAGESMDAIATELSDKLYPEDWDKLVLDFPDVIKNAEEEAIKAIAKLYGVVPEFYDCESVAAEIIRLLATV